MTQTGLEKTYATKATDIVVKWLPMPVGEYLKQGLPNIDYTQEGRTFIPTVLGDIDVGEMFHNFQTHESGRLYLGARAINTRDDGSVEDVEFWHFSSLNFRNKCSPYIAYQGKLRILEIAQKHPSDVMSEFQWEKADGNWPHQSVPQAMVLQQDKELATCQKTYVDDI